VIHIPLQPIAALSWGTRRHREPVRIGVPLPRGIASDAAVLGAVDANGDRAPCHAQGLDRWPDGSIRWALVDLVVDSDDGRARGCALVVAPGAIAGDATAGLPKCTATQASGEVRVDTGQATFVFRPGGAFPISDVVARGESALDAGVVSVAVGGSSLECRLARAVLIEAGPLRAEVAVAGELVDASGDAGALRVSATVRMLAGTAISIVDLVIHNPRRAQHPDGHWVLGDRGSIFIESMTMAVRPRGGVRTARLALHAGDGLDERPLPIAIHQESSGGEAWQGPVHRDRTGAVPLRFRGFHAAFGGERVDGLRATPIVACESASGAPIAMTSLAFWQNFPKTLRVDAREIACEVFPADASGPHELQGGEQKTHTLALAFGADAISDPPLAWIHDPVRIYPAPDWCCGSGALPFVVSAPDDTRLNYLTLVDEAIAGNGGLLSKRETADEYGWRHFGDLPADHESAFLPPDAPRHVSHYNNQYDAIAAFATHFLRSGDARWWTLMDDLARHVRDIDIYRTTEDKSAYNGGLFWHTAHYTDAGTSTHRSYPIGSHGGGPSAEHNYNAGLMLHYFMTGERASRDAAVGLAQWVVDMDDGRLSPLRWIASGPTGWASATGSFDYHGPGRGAANSILACLVGYRLTGNAAFARKADDLIRRCIHPDDDVEARHLLDVERRWYYTVFLQALGVYLHEKDESGARDGMYAYAEAALVKYARWMTAHERPYLSHPEILEFPTETWAAQDLRKAEALQWAALHAAGADRAAFQKRAAFFLDEALTTLAALPSHRFTRPTILLLTQGVRYPGLAAAIAATPDPGAPAPGTHGARQSFVPQKTIALRRLKMGLAIGGALSLIGLGVLLW
jgi:hypothetical protein